jgi:hypothetical protein
MMVFNWLIIMIGLGGHIRILSLYIVSIGQLCRKIIQKLEDEEFWKVFTMIVEIM